MGFFFKKYLPILIHFSLIEFLIQIKIIVGKSLRMYFIIYHISIIRRACEKRDAYDMTLPLDQ